MTKRKTLIAIAATLTLGLGGAHAYAGQQWGPSLVIITDSASGAFGELTDVRRSADSLEFIGCTIGGASAYQFASCAAEDATGKTRTCYSVAAPVIAAVASLDHGSEVVFWWDASGVCTGVNVSHYSAYSF